MVADAEYVLKKALKLGADDAVVNAEAKNTTQVKFVNNEVAVAQSWSEDKLDIFLALNKRLVSTTVTAQSQPGMARVLDNLVSMARVTAPKEEYMGIAQGPFKYKTVKGGCDEEVAAMENHGRLIEEAIRAGKEEGAERVSGILEAVHYSRSVLTSGGGAGKEEGTTLFFSIRAFAGEGSGHGVSCARELRKFNPGEAGRRAAEVARLSRRRAAGRKGRYKALFDPLAFAPMVEVTGEAASVFSVEAGFSYLANKTGKRVGSEEVTLLDDGALENGLLSRSFDEEGVPTRRTPIISKGRLVGYLHNTSTAKRYGTKTTGNAGLISPRPWNLILQPGRGRKKRALEELDKGIYITNTWYTRFQNYRTGDFSTVPRDGVFLVEDGEIKAGIKGVRVSDNLERMLKGVDWLSRESQQIRSWEVRGSVTAPWVIVDNVRITKATR